MKSIQEHMERIANAKQKGMLNLLVEVVLLIAVVVLVAVLVFQVTADTREDLVADSTGYNATLDADAAIAKIPKNLKILATAVVFAVIIYVIMRVIPMARPSGGSTF